jgi:hypothetical protein
VADAREAVVEVHVDGRKVALGGVVDANGGILTKASALNLRCMAVGRWF